MSGVYGAVVFLHVLAALFWLGGMFFLAVVGAPVLRSVEPPEMRARLFQELGLRFRGAGWVAIATLIATGLVMTWQRGLLRSAILLDATWWATPFGRAFFWKLLAVGFMVAASALHDFILGPMAGREGAFREGARRWGGLLARVNAVVGIVLLYWAVRLARGG